MQATAALLARDAAIAGTVADESFSESSSESLTVVQTKSRRRAVSQASTRHDGMLSASGDALYRAFSFSISSGHVFK